MAQAVSPGTNNAGSTNIMVETGSNDFGEKIAQIFGESRASPVSNRCEKNTRAEEEEGVYHECEECEYRSRHNQNLQRHMANMHNSILDERKRKKDEKKKGEKMAKRKKMEEKEENGNEEWRVVKRERILELAPKSSDYIQSLTMPHLLPEKTERVRRRKERKGQKGT